MMTKPGAARDNVKERLRLLEARKELRDGSVEHKQLDRHSRLRYAQAAKDLLGALNAGSIAPRHIDDLRPSLDVASGLGLEEAEPILHWVIENIVARYADTNEVRRFVMPAFEGATLTAELCAISEPVGREPLLLDPTSESELFIEIGPGEREKALKFLCDWFSEHGSDYLKLVDPYFGRAELDVIQRLAATTAGVRFMVVTSRNHQDGVEQPWDESYRSYWRSRISEEAPPDVDITIVGLEGTGKAPNHDRFFITSGSAVKSGASLNGYGGQQFSMVIMSDSERQAAEALADSLLTRTMKRHGGARVLYSVVTL